MGGKEEMAVFFYSFSVIYLASEVGELLRHRLVGLGFDFTLLISGLLLFHDCW